MIINLDDISTDLMCNMNDIIESCKVNKMAMTNLIEVKVPIDHDFIKYFIDQNEQIVFYKKERESLSGFPHRYQTIMYSYIIVFTDKINIEKIIRAIKLRVFS